MKNAQEIASAIADAVTKQMMIEKTGNSQEREKIQESSWDKLKSKVNDRIVNIHDTVFQKSLEILTQK